MKYKVLIACIISGVFFGAGFLTATLGPVGTIRTMLAIQNMVAIETELGEPLKVYAGPNEGYLPSGTVLVYQPMALNNAVLYRVYVRVEGDGPKPTGISRRISPLQAVVRYSD